MRRAHLLEAGVFAVGLAIGISCANDSSAQTIDRIIPDDTVAVSRILGIVRGSNPFVCEMSVRAADNNGSWSNWGSISGGPLMVDSASSALLDWLQHSHNDPALVAPLRAAMRDDDTCVRRVAGSLLSRVKHPSATAAFTAALDDAKAGTREVAALGLGMAEADGAADALQGKLRDAAPEVRRAAAWALGELEVKKAVPALIDLLAKDSDARVRQTAAWAIGSIR